MKSFMVGFRKFGREYKVGMDESRVSASLAVEHLTAEQMGKLSQVYQGLASEVAGDLRNALMQGMGLDEFTEQVAEKIREKLKGDHITLASGYKTTIENYVDTIVRTSVRKARDEGNKVAALSSGIIDEEWCIAISTRLPNTCKFCRARHGHKIKMSDPILLHPRCNCSRSMLYKKELGIPQTYTKRELDAQRKRIKKEPADWKVLQEKAGRTLV